MSGPEASLPDLSEAREVLIVKPSSLGDIVHTLPAVTLLKRTWPKLQIRWVVNAEWAPLIEGSPLLAEVIPFPRQEFRGPAGWVRGARWFWRFGAPSRPVPDVAFDFQGLLRSALIARSSGAAFVAGLSDAREGAPHLYSRVLPVDAGTHAVDRYLDLVRGFGAGVSDDAFDIDLPPGDPCGTNSPDRFVLVHPFARGQGKSLPWTGVAALARGLEGWAVVVVGMTKSPPPQCLPDNVSNLANATTLGQLIWLMRRAAFVVSVDSGPMHLASALRRPLLGIHTWSDPRKVGPYDPQAWIWKGGGIGHRSDITADLASRTETPSENDVSAMAAHVLARLAAMAP